MRLTPFAIPILLLLAGAAAGHAQSATQWIPAECQDILNDLATAQPGPQLDSVMADAFKLKRSPTCYARLFLQRNSVTSAGFSSFLKKLEALRTDKQAGSSGGSSGGTNLAAKGVTAKLLSVAAETGALTETLNEQVVTVQGSLDGPIALLVRKDLVPYCLETSKHEKGCLGEPVYSFLRRISYGVSFNANANSQMVNGTASGTPDGTAQPVSFSATGQQLAGWSARAVIWNARDNVSHEFRKKWDDTLAGTATPPSDGTTPANPGALTDAAKATLQPLENLIGAAQIPASEFEAWFNQSVEAMRGVNLRVPAAVNKVWRERVDLYLDMVEKNNPKVVDAALAFIQAMSRYDFEQRAFVEAVEDKPVATLEVADHRPVGQAETTSIRFIFDRGLKHGWSLTINGGLEIYNAEPTAAGVSRFRDAQFALQFQKDLGTSSLLGAAAIAATYYFQYQNAPAILNVTPGTPLPGITFTGLPDTATTVFASKGSISIGQIRLVLGPGQSSVRFPLAVSYSNRTELIPKPAWKAQIGISYDFDSLFSK